MDLKQLKYFRAAAEELHFQRAARRLNLSQPALSHQIKKLETELRLTLIDRSRNHVALTDAGTVFLARVTEILKALDVAVAEAQAAAGAAPKMLRLGYVGYLNLEVIATSIARFRAACPKVELQQVEMPTAEVYAALKEDQIDLGFATLPATHPALKTRKIADGYWSVVVASQHEFAGREPLLLAELRDQPLIFFDRCLNSALYDLWMERFAVAGFEPRIVFETRQVQTALNMARRGNAIYLAASYIVGQPPEGLARVRVTGFDNEVAIGAAWHEDNKSSELSAFLDLVRAQS
jgi:DNA-binding transcriptional LysR family regulator